MKAMRLHQPAPIDQRPLRLEEIARPQAGPGEIVVRVRACGVCHTDLHVTEGDLPQPTLPVVPGHEIVGEVAEPGAGVTRFEMGERVGIPWLHHTCGECAACLRGQENLCEQARFTGYTAQGGYAEYATVAAEFAVPLPHDLPDVALAPLLCAGIVGYRSLRLSEVQAGQRLGLYGFGASAHICIQVARHWGCEVYVFTRSDEHQRHAREMGAAWTGQAQDKPPDALDSAVIFAPAGWIVPLALGHLRPGGTLAINAIHLSDVPAMPYDLLWHERTVRSVANATRRDAEEFMPLAAAIPIHTDTERYPLEEANAVLQRVKRSEIKGAAVLTLD